MKRRTCKKIIACGLALAASGLIMTPRSDADPLNDLQPKLPPAVLHFTARPPDRFYDELTIFDYINGAGEVYRAYNFKGCLARRYAAGDGSGIVLDVFDMGSAADAFGVFTHDTEGAPVTIGQEGRLRPGWLRFWKHRFFVSITAEEETPQAGTALEQLGTAVAAAIPATGRKPALLSLLPKEGISAQAVRYLHHPIILNYHYYLADENILGLSPHTEAALAGYRREDAKAQVLIVLYPDSKAAQSANRRFLRLYLPEAGDTGFAKLENGKWAGARTSGQLLAVVLEADRRELAQELLEEIMTEHSGR